MRHLSLPCDARSWASAQLNGFSQIFLQRHPGCGILLLCAIAIGAPDLLGGALLGGFASWLTALRRGYPRDDVEAGLYGYNGVLLGMLLCTRFAWTLHLPLLIICCAGLSTLLLHRLLRNAREREWLPAFTSPFVGFGWLLLWLAHGLQLTALPTPPATIFDADAAGLALALVRGFGQVIFLADPVAGACVFLGLLLASWRVALWALFGSALSLALGLWLRLPTDALLAGLFSLNGVLIGITLGKRLASLPVVVIGVALGTLLQPGFAAFQLPAMTAPFILACWLVIAGGRLWRQNGTRPRPTRLRH
ncbi:urea transporter [Pseudomonas sp. PDM13]|uniref:urea transporter n=1 Tax=Pseudomonas sp. PDM13 TaxID=2769255 RepID=UPI0021E0F3E3|nr:urea transporter [Pseudomonas sp. PDM13]MCU9948634.1 urea transporter [Pseudomonas sp. PDM13]